MYKERGWWERGREEEENKKIKMYMEFNALYLQASLMI